MAALNNNEEAACAFCHITGVPLKACSRCNILKYCTVECQTRHWKGPLFGGEVPHKVRCRELSQSCNVKQKTIETATKDIDSLYPRSKANLRRWVINVPSIHQDSQKRKELERKLKVAVWFGKWTIGDGFNSYWIMKSDDKNLGASLTEKRTDSSKRYWEVEGNCGIWNSQIGCEGNPERVPIFAEITSSTLIEYDSASPIVVYAPEDIDVKWRIWRADNKVNDALSC